MVVLAIVAAGSILLLGVGVPTIPPAWFVGAITALLAGAVVLLLGLGLRDRRRHERALAQAAAHQAVLEDRIIVARDLHDLVSHGLGAITVRAGVGMALARDEPEESLRALLDITALSRQATAELRSLIGVLDDPDAPLLTTSLEGLQGLAALVQRYQRQGLDVTLEQAAGAESETVTAVHVVAEKVVAEALANVARHAGPTVVQVVVRTDQTGLAVDIRDDGPAPGWVGQRGTGHGLRLLSQRVAAVGGTLSAGPDGPGFLVLARLPHAEASP